MKGKSSWSSSLRHWGGRAWRSPSHNNTMYGKLKEQGLVLVRRVHSSNGMMLCHHLPGRGSAPRSIYPVCKTGGQDSQSYNRRFYPTTSRASDSMASSSLSVGGAGPRGAVVDDCLPRNRRNSNAFFSKGPPFGMLIAFRQSICSWDQPHPRLPRLESAITFTRMSPIGTLRARRRPYEITKPNHSRGGAAYDLHTKLRKQVSNS